VHYRAVLADLERKKAGLEDLIAALRAAVDSECFKETPAPGQSR
jgi:hypothetical protein